MAKKTQGMHPLFDSVEMGIGTWQWGDRMIWGYQQEYHETDLQEAFNASLEAGIRFSILLKFTARGNPNGYWKTG
jgi:hypothetical protein